MGHLLLREEPFLLVVYKSIGMAALFMATIMVSADNQTNMLTDTCIVCHGNNGASAGPAIPNLSSMSPNYLMGAMLAYKYENTEELNKIIDSDDRFQDVEAFARNSTIMSRIAKGYSETEIKIVADHFSRQKLYFAKQRHGQAEPQAGKELHEKYCASCHENEGKSSDGDSGVLAGQWKPYFLYSMDDFLNGNREMPKKMKSKLSKMIAGSGKSSLDQLADYYASISN